MSRPHVGTPATVELTRLCIGYSTHLYEHDASVRSFGHEAAAALGLRRDEVYKTLIAMVDLSMVVAVIPVSAKLDMKALASACGGRRAELADPAAAQRATGYVVGGISPIGQKRALPTVIDEEVVLLEKVYVSGGRRGLDLGLRPDDLITATGATLAAIARNDDS